MSVTERACGAGVIAPPPLLPMHATRHDVLTLRSAATEASAYLPPDLQRLLDRLLAPLPKSGANDSPEGRVFFQTLLHGPLTPELPEIDAAHLSWFDGGLDKSQRQAVCQAVNTADVFVLAGHAGTGKSRVLAEIVRQAIQHGTRVLFVAPSAAAINVVLSRIGETSSAPIFRCDQNGVAQSPDFADQLLDKTRNVLDDHERGYRELESQEPHVDDTRLAAITGELAALRTSEPRALADLEQHHAAISELQREIARSDTVFSRLMFWRTRNIATLQARLQVAMMGRQSAEKALTELRQRAASLESEQQMLTEAAERELQQWRLRMQQTDAALVALRRWHDAVVACRGELHQRWRETANLIAIHTDGDLSDYLPAAASMFDMLILDEAHRLSEADLLRWAQHARKWVLSGEPAANRCTGKPRCDCGFWPHLWQCLHVDTWYRENGAWRCRWQPPRSVRLADLRREPVADRPDIELRIRANSGPNSDLVEVAFPAAMSLETACQYVFRELQELPAPAGRPEWVQQDGNWLCRWCDQTPSASADLEPGVSALFHAGKDEARLIGVRFDGGAGWSPEKAEAWIAMRTRCVDPGRSVLLQENHRQTPALRRFVADLDQLHSGVAAAPAFVPASTERHASHAIEFIPVPALPITMGNLRRGDPGWKGGSVRLPPLRGGAGLEIDLSNTAERQRLPAELQTLLPGHGIVNPAEAEAILRWLETFADDVAGGPDQPSVGVLPLHAAQVELLRFWLHRSDLIRRAAARVEVMAAGAAGQLEWDVVLISLTRSQTRRAVTYGDRSDAIWSALCRARRRVLFFGDAGTLLRRSHWEGRLEHLDEAVSARERTWVQELIRRLQGHPTATPVHLHEGPG